MRVIQIILCAAAVMLLTSSVMAGPVLRGDPQVIVELVPDNPGPYFGGELLNVDFWLNSNMPRDERLEFIRFDFSDTDWQFRIAPTFTFDFSTLETGGMGYDLHPDLPVPWTFNGLECFCPVLFLLLPAEGSLHVGSIALELPLAQGVYQLDVLNYDEPWYMLGAEVRSWWGHANNWRAYDGQITGGTFDFAVIPEPATITFLIVGGFVFLRRRNRGPGQVSHLVGTSRSRGIGAHQRRPGRLHPSWLCAGVFSLGVATTVSAQLGETIQISIDSGVVSATGGGVEPGLDHHSQ